MGRQIVPPSARTPRRATQASGFGCYGPAVGPSPRPNREVFDTSPLSAFFAPGELLAFWELWNPSAVNYTDGAGERLPNGDFESGGTGWIVVPPAVRTIQAGDIGGGGGAQYCEIGCPVASTAVYIYAAGLVVGARYYVWGWVTGDGANGYPQLRNGGTILWTGTTSAAPQFFAVEFTAALTTLRLYTQGNAATSDLSNWDNLHMVECPGIVTVPNLLSPGTYDLDFTLGSQQAWLHPTAWLGAYPCAMFDGVGHFGECHALAAQLSGVAQPACMFTVLQHLTHINLARQWGFGNAGNATPSYESYQSNATGRTGHWRRNDAAALFTQTGNNVDLAGHAHALRYDGTDGDGYVDAALDIAPAALGGGQITLDRGVVGAQQRGGVTSNFTNSLYREMAALAVAPSDPRLLAFSRRLMARNFL